MKATHKGHCQYCNALQKLPNGVLSNHGYTVEYNFFNGICFGSGRLPYEQSCDLIADSIRYAITRKEELNAEIVRLSQPATEAKGKVRLYLNYKYLWLDCEIVLENDKFYAVTNKDRFFIGHRRGSDTVLTEMDHQRSRLTDEYRKTVFEIGNYIDFQQKRLNDWKLRELSPLK